MPRSLRVSSTSTQSATLSAFLQPWIQQIQSQLGQAANPQNAQAMQRYCKTTMPMYGIQKPKRAMIEKEMYSTLKDFISEDSMDIATYQQLVRSLWNLPHREEKYLAIDLAMHYKNCITWDSLSMYQDMLREEYMWWDLCDPIAINLVGKLLRQEYSTDRPKVQRLLRQWIREEEYNNGNVATGGSSRWIRRTAILAQLKWKQDTDADLLFELCRERMQEKEFFIRKAIGWALREYSRTNPDAVKVFLRAEKANLSGLSYREGSKLLVKQGQL